MQIEKTESQSSLKEQQGKSTKHWWCIGLALFLVLVAFYYIGGRAVGTAEPWVWNRGDNEPAAKNSGFTLWVGSMASHVGMVSATASSHSENDAVDFSRVVVLTSNAHPLGIACAEKIAEKLKTIPAIQQIEFVPYSSPLIGKDKPLPPWFVYVDADNLNERTMPTRSLTGDIAVSSGNSFRTIAQKIASTHGDTSPFVDFANRSKYDIQVSFTGISSQSRFYDNIAEDVAKRAVSTIEEAINKLNSIHLTLPKLPDAFYPAYREASDLSPIPGLVSTTTLVDGRRFMLPHHSLVQIETNFAGTNEKFFSEIQQAMNEAGWETRGISETGLRLVKGNETFHFSEDKQGGFLLERTIRMDDNAILPAIQALLDENAPASALLPFTERVMRPNNAILREQMRAHFLELKISDPREQLALARFFHRIGDMDIAKEMLFRAWQIRQLTLYPRQDNDYTELAKQLGVEAEMKALPLPTAELCEEFGFILLSPENCPMELDIAVNKEVKFVAVADNGNLSLLQFTVHYENGKFVRTESMWASFHPHGHSYSSSKSSGPNFMNHLRVGNQERARVGDQEGTFYFSLVSESALRTDGTIRVRVEFR